jgi:putative DNA primase/helicase
VESGKMDTSKIPKELKSLVQWVCWKLETTEEGKATKVPYVAKGGFPKKASVTNPDDWRNDRLALEICQKQKFDGIGFMFTQNDQYCGIDLDHCIDEAGNIETWAADILNRFNSYAEKSPSGRGIHVSVKGKLGGPGTKKPLPGYSGAEVEIYDQKRYLTFTGDVINGYDTIQERQGDVTWLYTTINPKPEKKPVKTIPKAADHTNDEIVQKIRKSKQADKFNKLMDGDISGYPSGGREREAAI